MDLDLSGKTALVTGSTRGIGFETAVGLAEMGAKVIVHGRSGATVNDALARLGERVADAGAIGIAANLGTAKGCDALAAAHPDVDVLVNNVGIYKPEPFDEVSDETWQMYFDINVMSGVRMARHYLKGMLARDWGRVIFVSSESGVFIPPEMIHYGFSKAAQLAIARGLAETTKGTKVTVNSVLPGPTWVEIQESRMGKRAGSEGRTVEDLKAEVFATRRQSSLLQRYETPDEVANMICYVCSLASSGTNGASLRVEGGIVRSFV
jgi:NAD(P)-dependent dehydrogenase (short-subunit alcohol dehydrogenase family)